MSDKVSDTPFCDKNEVDLSEVVSTAMYTDGKRRVVRKYVPSHIVKVMEKELNAANAKLYELNAANFSLSMYAKSLEAKLATARDEAYEHAAQKCELITTNTTVDLVGRGFAHEIRSLKSSSGG